MNKILNFQSLNIELDYLTLNLANSRSRLEEIAEIFFQLGFNSYAYDDEKQTNKTILQNEEHCYFITFRLEKNRWNKETLLIQISGENSRRFYQILKNQEFSLSELNCQALTIGRINLHFIRKNQKQDSPLIDSFEKSKKICQGKRKKALIIPNSNSDNDNFEYFSLVIGSRGSDYYARVYQQAFALKFELEIKKGASREFGVLLVHKSFLEFETQLTKQFLSYFITYLNLEYSYTYWLVHQARIMKDKPTEFLVGSYMEKHFLTLSKDETITFYRLLQFLSFVRAYQMKEIDVIGQTYCAVEFKLSNFMLAVGSSKNTYQRDKFREFFEDLQGFPPFREKFAKRKFRKLLFFPVVNSIQKTERGPWIIQVAIAEQLLVYSYLFQFPSSFFKESNGRNLDIKLSIVLAFA